MCVAPVYDIDELENDAQLIARGMIVESEHPDKGKVKHVGSMHKLSESPIEVRNWATTSNQHTDEILREIGYDDSRISELREADVIG